MFAILFAACVAGTVILVVAAVVTVIADRRHRLTIDELGRAFLERQNR